jgi:hypothetical protein
MRDFGSGFGFMAAKLARLPMKMKTEVSRSFKATEMCWLHERSFAFNDLKNLIDLVQLSSLHVLLLLQRPSKILLL